MTERHARYLVTLSDGLSREEALRVVSVLLMVQGVSSVEPVRAARDVIMTTGRDTDAMREQIEDLLKGIQ